MGRRAHFVTDARVAHHAAVKDITEHHAFLSKLAL